MSEEERFDDPSYHSVNFEIVMIYEQGTSRPSEETVKKALEKSFGQLEEGAIKVVEI